MNGPIMIKSAMSKTQSIKIALEPVITAKKISAARNTALPANDKLRIFFSSFKLVSTILLLPVYSLIDTWVKPAVWQGGGVGKAKQGRKIRQTLKIQQTFVQNVSEIIH